MLLTTGFIQGVITTAFVLLTKAAPLIAKPSRNKSSVGTGLVEGYKLQLCGMVKRCLFCETSAATGV